MTFASSRYVTVHRGRYRAAGRSFDRRRFDPADQPVRHSSARAAADRRRTSNCGSAGTPRCRSLRRPPRRYRKEGPSRLTAVAYSARPVAVIVLAAGEGTRMKSVSPKVLHGFAGRTLLGHVLAAAEPLGAERTVVVIGHGRDAVREHLAA